MPGGQAGVARMGLFGSVSEPWPWAAALCLGLLYFVVKRPVQIRRNGTPLRRPPDSLPWLGNGIVFLQPRQKLFAWFAQREREFGYETYQISVPTLPPGVVINDPANLEYVFRNEAIFNKGEFVKRRSWDLFGHGIINADGDLWRAQRKAGLHFLNLSNLRALTDVALPRYLSASIDLLNSHARSGLVVDLQAVFHEITSQLMGKMAYSMEMHADDDFTVAFDYASGATAERFQNPLYPVTELVLGSRLRRSIAIIKAYGQRIVAIAGQDRHSAAAVAKPPGAPPSPTSSPLGEALPEDAALEKASGSLIQSLLDSIGDERMVADAALNYLSAGRDTVAQALTWTFYLLIQHPDAADAIRQEVRDALDDREIPLEQSHASIQPINTARLTPSAMPYTMAVFYEAMRLYPPIPIEIKQCMRSTTLPDGTFIPQSSVLLWSIWAMNRSRTTWGPDADHFRPDRWLSRPKSPSSGAGAGETPAAAAATFVSRSASEFPVFNGGARTCLGKKMAELMAVQVVPSMVSMFSFSPAYDTRYPRVSKSSLTLPMEGGLPCFVSRRSRRASES